MLESAPGSAALAAAGTPSRWTAAHVATIDHHALPATPVIAAGDIVRPIPGLDLWDFWPVQEADGRVATIGSGELWMALCAPAVGDPVERHGRARIRLLHLERDRWCDLGPALPDGFSPGSREWSGSAVVDPSHAHVTLFFTAAGRRGEVPLSYEQRLFQTRAVLSIRQGLPHLSGWTPPRQSVASDGQLYHPADQARGEVGKIKAFRDPGFFRDPADGRAYLLITASLGRSSSTFNGAIGLARAEDAGLERWRLLAPIVSADGLNNELERAHVLFRDGLYYLFWSTQRSVFAPGGPSGPTGLYGMVAPSLLGPYEPINASGLVLCNPPLEPHQAYSWLVLPDWSVASFVDLYGLNGRGPANAVEARAHFGGAPAPALRLAVDGSRVELIV